MDYRVIDSLYHKIETLRLNVEYRHQFIAARNAQLEAEGFAPTVKNNILADANIQEYTAAVAKETRGVLLEALQMLEAGQPLPRFLRNFIDYLSATTPDLSYKPALEMIWQSQAGQFLARITPYFAQESTQTAEAGNTSTAEETPLKVPYFLPTIKSREELARIFHALTKAGYIAGAAPDALTDFVNAFCTQNTPAREPGKQGRINWIWTDKRRKTISPRHILDFATIMNGCNPSKTVTDELIKNAVPAIFGGLQMSKSVPSKFSKDWWAGIYSEVHAKLSQIINE